MKSFFAKLLKHLSLVYKIIAIGVTALLILLIFHKDKVETYDYSTNGFWRGSDLYAPFDFPILKSDEEIAAERQDAKNSGLTFFRPDSSAQAATFRKIDATAAGTQLKSEVKSYLSAAYGKGIVETPDDIDLSGRNIILLVGNVGQERPADDLVTIEQCAEHIQTLTPDTALAQALVAAIRPNIAFDPDRTRLEQESMLALVSTTEGMVSAGELMISKGEYISPEKERMISSLEYERQQRTDDQYSAFNHNLGLFLLTIIALATLFFFLRLIRHPLLNDNKKVNFVLFVILLMAVMTSVMTRINPDWTLLVPLCIAPILMRVFFDIRVALYIHLVNTIILASWVPNSYEFIYYQIITGMVSIISVKNFEQRSKFFIASLSIFASYSLVYIAGLLSQDTTLSDLDLRHFAIFFFNAMLTLLAYPLIYLFEKMFGFVTKLTLIELSSTNNKALRDLADKAPGTFQHSVQVANISEDLIHEIGGNAMLTKVGALYHDIGKTENPQFFTENQSADFNPLNDFSNTESAQIIINHVTDGVELAKKKYHLPEVIIDFIRTHHGTSKVGYFYNKQMNENGGQPVDEADFMYAGPRPYSRETAVVMLVDSVEAAVRSLKERNEESIGNIIDRVIDAKIADNQLSNCDITFRDIDKIKLLLKKRMVSIYHVRVEYPVIKTKNSD
ncbi:MAG: HDIG domain-containing protein [Bacteroidales bacterium]|nr:HDIG domain-containing protein [Bacteroidales bacterium]